MDPLRHVRRVLVAVALLGCAGAALAHQPGFTDSFLIDRCRFADEGDNPFFLLRPGYELVLEGREGQASLRVTITVTDQTRVIDGVTTRVVEERETRDGELVEVSRNFYAVCEPTNTVFYFGEDVDLYEGGKFSGHGGSWRAGRGGARAGVAMPGHNFLGARYVQEIAPGIAMDRAETVGLNEVLATPAGDFTQVLKVEETTPLEPGVREYKYYVAGIGLVQDSGLKLAKLPVR